jgi:hypothetical protein
MFGYRVIVVTIFNCAHYPLLFALVVECFAFSVQPDFLSGHFSGNFGWLISFIVRHIDIGFVELYY